MKVYHNPRCSKSRQALELLKEEGKEFEVVEYLKQSPSAADIQSLVQMLGVKPIEMMRTKEKLFIEQFKGKNLTDAEYIQAMAEHPVLIERPIIVSNGKAVIGRPTEKIRELF